MIRRRPGPVRSSTGMLDVFKRGEIDFPGRDRRCRARARHRACRAINYDVPTHADDYVHRVLWTGRAGQGGPRLHLGAARGAPLRRCDHQVDGQGNPALELPGVEPGAAERAGAAASAAARSGARARKRAPRPAAPKPAERRPSAPKPSRAKPPSEAATRRADRRGLGPVVGMGDHVPLFMRYLNAELLPKLNDD